MSTELYRQRREVVIKTDFKSLPGDNPNYIVLFYRQVNVDGYHFTQTEEGEPTVYLEHNDKTASRLWISLRKGKWVKTRECPWEILGMPMVTWSQHLQAIKKAWLKIGGLDFFSNVPITEHRFYASRPDVEVVVRTQE